MRRRTAKNYPRRKAWVVLAKNIYGILAVLTPSGKFIKLREGGELSPRLFTVSDKDLAYYNPKKFRKAAYKATESKSVMHAERQVALTTLVDGWEVFIARLGSAKCPVDSIGKDGKVFLTLKKEIK